MKAQFYHWFVGGKVLHLPGDYRANLCGIEGWDESGDRAQVRRYFGKRIPPVCKRCKGAIR